jgi:hypothetical protein
VYDQDLQDIDEIAKSDFPFQIPLDLDCNLASKIELINFEYNGEEKEYKQVFNSAIMSALIFDPDKNKVPDGVPVTEDNALRVIEFYLDGKIMANYLLDEVKQGNNPLGQVGLLIQLIFLLEFNYRATTVDGTQCLAKMKVRGESVGINDLSILDEKSKELNSTIIDVSS